MKKRRTLSRPLEGNSGLVFSFNLFLPWIHNAVIYTALIFDGKLLQTHLFWGTTLLVGSFCLADTSIFLFQQKLTRKTDRSPHKQPRDWTILASILLAALSVIITTWLSRAVGGVMAAYLLLTVLYLVYLNTIVMIDVMVLALGLLVRVFAGVLFVRVEQFSPWLYVCVTLLALFLGFGQRRHEMTRVKAPAALRVSPEHPYTVYLLDQVLLLVMASLLVTYTLYTLGASTALVSSGYMLLTVPFVFFFMARYLYLIHSKHVQGTLEELLFQDKPLLVNSLLWVLAVVAMIYGWPTR